MITGIGMPMAQSRMPRMVEPRLLQCRRCRAEAWRIDGKPHHIPVPYSRTRTPAKNEGPGIW
jgi:hypothetical protein